MSILNLPRAFHVNSAGVPYGLAKLYHYRAGTLTTLNLYTDATYNTAHAQPVEANANGLFPAMYLDPEDGYDLRLILQDANGVQIYDEDDIPRSESVFGAAFPVEFLNQVNITGTLSVSGVAGATSFSSGGASPKYTLIETDQGTDLQQWHLLAESQTLYLRATSDGGASPKTILSATRGSGSAIASIAIGNASDSPAVTINGVSAQAANTFTATLTGMSGATSFTANYRITNNFASVYFPAGPNSGTSNTTAMTLTGLPSACQVLSGALRIVPCQLIDNGVTTMGWAQITNSGTITFGLGVTPTGAFTGSGTKGIATGAVLIYPL
jgi:hypothetical protein